MYLLKRRFVRCYLDRMSSAVSEKYEGCFFLMSEINSFGFPMPANDVLQVLEFSSYGGITSGLIHLRPICKDLNQYFDAQVKLRIRSIYRLLHMQDIQDGSYLRQNIRLWS